MGYMHIDNLYKNQDILLFRECYAMEKVHGTSAHVSWKGNQLHLYPGGEKLSNFELLIIKDPKFIDLPIKFAELIGYDKHCIVFGELYGGKCQAMSETYGKQLKFIAFEVKIEDCWLDVPKAEELAKKIGFDFVPYERISTDLKAIDEQRDRISIVGARNGCTPAPREGVVLRPLIEVIKVAHVPAQAGERIIAKHKQDWARETKTPREISPEQQKILSDAQAIADEWVTPMRLEHVLQEHPECIGMEHTGIIIKSMIADIMREAKDEAEFSKLAYSIIGKVTAKLWEQKVKNSLKKFE